MVLNCISFYHQVVLNDIPWFLYCWSLLMDFRNVLIPNSIHWFHSCNSKHRYPYVNLRHMYFIFSVLCCPTFNFVLHIIKLAMREDRSDLKAGKRRKENLVESKCTPVASTYLSELLHGWLETYMKYAGAWNINSGKEMFPIEWKWKLILLVYMWKGII